jgi:hypothetical protein
MVHTPKSFEVSKVARRLARILEITVREAKRNEVVYNCSRGHHVKDAHGEPRIRALSRLEGRCKKEDRIIGSTGHRPERRLRARNPTIDSNTDLSGRRRAKTRIEGQPTQWFGPIERFDQLPDVPAHPAITTEPLKRVRFNDQISHWSSDAVEV